MYLTKCIVYFTFDIIDIRRKRADTKKQNERADL